MRNLWFCSNFGNLKVGTLVFLKLRVMEPSRPISNLSASTSCNSTVKYVYKRSKKSPGISIIQRSEEAVVKVGRCFLLMFAVMLVSVVYVGSCSFFFFDCHLVSRKMI